MKEIGFYLSPVVKVVVVFDPYTLLALHVRKDSASHQVSLVTIDLACGCRYMV